MEILEKEENASHAFIYQEGEGNKCIQNRKKQKIY